MPKTGFLENLLIDQRGATAVEYGLIAALIVIAMIGSLKGVAAENSRNWILISTTVLQNATQGAGA